MRTINHHRTWDSKLRLVIENHDAVAFGRMMSQKRRWPMRDLEHHGRVASAQTSHSSGEIKSGEQVVIGGHCIKECTRITLRGGDVRTIPLSRASINGCERPDPYVRDAGDYRGGSHDTDLHHLS
ncbi:hypothetical protein TNCV_4870041 [Trichonephila clavipes]|nr:hypothetical protein TNCV_4870041 [Trichonephila clavipes]